MSNMVLLFILYCQVLVDYVVDSCCLLAAVANSLSDLYLSSASKILRAVNRVLTH